ncbi:hypothetical protein F1C10_05985 [Sphingomonas sp. NBWT7]|uniref:hypothetical protein n=1 Tax=Sphingomonas sp. NBWT7 TaxID=2596913 RepID=UPI00162321CB|nr:hypothetical protein [Sphingomonas sp. NBWT7]QNE31527.1 hypothetical protein F1C10_05985 [Sphingomonas sp. NBWT7]
MPRFILHIGTHKTGTSAFQQWATRNRAALRDAGFLYPETGATPDGNHHALSLALAGGEIDAGRRIQILRQFDDELRAAPDAAVLISAETMSTVRFFPLLPALRTAIETRGGSDLTAIVAVRDQLAWRNSCYAQMREMLTAVPPFDRFFMPGPHGVHSGNWEYLDDRYTRAGFALQAIACDAAFRRNGVVHALTRLACLSPLADIDTADRQEANPSLSALQLIVADEVRSAIAGPDGSVDWPLRNLLVPLVIRHSEALAGPSFNGHTPHAAAAYSALFEESNARFAERHFGRAWHDVLPPAPLKPLSPCGIDDLRPAQRRAVMAAVERVLTDPKAVRRMARLAAAAPAADKPSPASPAPDAANAVAPPTRTGPPARILLHAGFAKTGTTAFQESLATHRAALLEAGYLLPTAGVNATGNASTLLTGLAGRLTPAQNETIARRFHAEVAAHQGDHVIISSESVTAPLLTPRRREIAEALTANGNPVTVLLAVRDQVALLNSAYAQMRAQFHARDPFEDYVAKIVANGRLDWNRQRTSFEELGLDFTPLAYTRAVQDEGIVRALARLPELAPLAPVFANAAEHRANRSAGWKQLLVAEALRVWLEDEGRAMLPVQRHALRGIVDRQMADIPDAPFNGFHPTLLAYVREQYAESNDTFAARHFDTQWALLFPRTPLPPRSPASFDDLAADVATQLRGIVAACRDEAETSIDWTMPHRAAA